MSARQLPVYPDKVLRINLTTNKATEQIFDLKTMKEYVGGTGIGARILYDEVKPGVEWSDPENRLIFATGPLAGTRAAGSGTFSFSGSCAVASSHRPNNATTSRARRSLRKRASTPTMTRNAARSRPTMARP